MILPTSRQVLRRNLGLTMSRTTQDHSGSVFPKGRPKVLKAVGCSRNYGPFGVIDYVTAPDM